MNYLTVLPANLLVNQLLTGILHRLFHQFVIEPGCTLTNIQMVTIDHSLESLTYVVNILIEEYFIYHEMVGFFK